MKSFSVNTTATLHLLFATIVGCISESNPARHKNAGGQVFQNASQEVKVETLHDNADSTYESGSEICRPLSDTPEQELAGCLKLLTDDELFHQLKYLKDEDILQLFEKLNEHHQQLLFARIPKSRAEKILKLLSEDMFFKLVSTLPVMTVDSKLLVPGCKDSIVGVTHR